MTKHSPQTLHAVVRIAGMTCGSCELLLEKKLKAVPGVMHADVDYRTGIARITARMDHLPSEETIAAVIRKAGYSLADEDAPTVSSVPMDQRKWMEIGGSLLVIFALYKILQTLDLVSLTPSTSDVLSLGGIFVIGLVAGTSSCLAVTGGLLLAMAAKWNETHAGADTKAKFTPLLHFNIGRLASYFVLGGFTGVLGKSITLSTKMTGFLNIGVALLMLYLALKILELMPKGSFPIRPPKRLSRWIVDLSESEHPGAPFTLGALTYFLPCGFTQSLQLVALASGSFLTGALTMFTFALGTLPSLLGISAISSTAKGTTSRLFLRFSGSLVLVLAFFNLNSGFALTGVNLATFLNSPTPAVGSAPAIQDGAQEIFMKVTPYGYEPSEFTVRAGTPVKWIVDGSGARGCTSILVASSLNNLFKPLTAGLQTIEFTPTNPGYIAFSCSMGMVRGTINVI